jgi:hypothetical protein
MQMNNQGEYTRVEATEETQRARDLSGNSRKSEAHTAKSEVKR